MEQAKMNRREFLSLAGVAGAALIIGSVVQTKQTIADTSWDLTKLEDFNIAICNSDNIRALLIMVDHGFLTSGNYVYEIEEGSFKQINYIGDPNMDRLKQELDKNYELIDFIPLKPQLTLEFPSNTDYTVEDICAVVLKIEQEYRNKQTDIDLTKEEYEALKAQYEALKAKYELAREKYEASNEETKGIAYTKKM